MFTVIKKSNTEHLQLTNLKKNYVYCGASQVALLVKNPTASAGVISNAGSIPGSGRSPGEEHGNPFLYYCLGNPMDRGAWQAAVHGVAKSWT